ATVFALPSHAEGFGMPVLEAMAQGAAVVTSTGTATEEVIGDTGVTVIPGDVEALADALVSLLDDEPKRTGLLLADVYREAVA
ncbi:MAG: glycosyltransferase, partial [Acidimicrobiales bacterium]